jgi:hypothetical protein
MLRSDTDNFPRNRTVTMASSFGQAIPITYQSGSEIFPGRYSQTAGVAHFLPNSGRQRQNPARWSAKSALIG